MLQTFKTSEQKKLTNQVQKEVSTALSYYIDRYRNAVIFFKYCLVMLMQLQIQVQIQKCSHTRAQSCPHFFQDPLSMKFSRQEYRNGLSFPFPGDLPDLGIKPVSHVVVVQSLSCVRLFATPWTAAYLFFTISQRLLTLIFIKLVMSFNHLILCQPLFLLPLIFPSISLFQ